MWLKLILDFLRINNMKKKNLIQSTQAASYSTQKDRFILSTFHLYLKQTIHIKQLVSVNFNHTLPSGYRISLCHLIYKLEGFCLKLTKETLNIRKYYSYSKFNICVHMCVKHIVELTVVSMGWEKVGYVRMCTSV